MHPCSRGSRGVPRVVYPGRCTTGWSIPVCHGGPRLRTGLGLGSRTQAQGQIQDYRARSRIPGSGPGFRDSRFQISDVQDPALECHFTDVRSRYSRQALLGGERPWIYPIYRPSAYHDVLYILRSVHSSVKVGILIETRFWRSEGPLLSPTTLF